MQFETFLPAIITSMPLLYREDPVIRSIRVRTWYYAVAQVSGLTVLELESRFSLLGQKAEMRSCIWNKYRSGEVAPRSGIRPDGLANVVDRVEAIYPGTAKWLTLPLWRLSDKAPMDMAELRRFFEGLPDSIRDMFLISNLESSDIFWRTTTPFDDLCTCLLDLENLHDLAAILAMVKEAEVTQNQLQHAACAYVAIIYVARLKGEFPNNAPLASLHKYFIDHFNSVRYSIQREKLLEVIASLEL